MTHGKHIFNIASDMDMSTVCAYESSKYALPHWKCVLRCCSQFTHIDIPITESYHKNSNVSPTKHFCEYQTISRCIVYGGHPFNKKKQCQLCEAYFDSIVTTKLYKRNDIFMMET